MLLCFHVQNKTCGWLCHNHPVQGCGAEVCVPWDLSLKELRCCKPSKRVRQDHTLRRLSSKRLYLHDISPPPPPPPRSHSLSRYFSLKLLYKYNEFKKKTSSPPLFLVLKPVSSPDSLQGPETIKPRPVFHIVSPTGCNTKPTSVHRPFNR